jgi:hypothetical protein
MNGRSTFRFLALLIVGILALSGVGLLMMFLNQAATATPTPVPQPSPGPPREQIVATVNGRAISHTLWVESVLLDQVMSGMAGQPAPTPEETLQRLINEALILEAFTSVRSPSPAEIEAHIAAMERSWGVEDSAVVKALQEVGLSRAALERSVGRLLRVQAAIEALRAQGYDEGTWLKGRLAEARVVINTELQQATVFPTPTTLAVAPTPTVLPSPTASPPVVSSPTPAGLAASLPTTAPDFTLERVDGGWFTLTQQLASGPVVLVFFQRCG